MKRGLFIFLGFLMFGLGTLGIFLPFLPTTVFYLLTGFFWLRSSERLYRKFIESKNYQKYVKHAILEKNISTAGMVRMFLVMLIIFLLPALLVDNFVMRVSLACVYILHVIILSWYLKGKRLKKANNKVTRIGEEND